MMVELFLCVGYHRERWLKALLPRRHPQLMAGEGLVIRSDGLGYYAWLRSIMIDGDWSFDNEFDTHNPLGDFVPSAAERTPRGYRANLWSVGPACAWALIVAPGHACLLALHSCLPWAADGYSLPYQLMVAAATLLWSFLGLILLYGICLNFADRDRAALTAAFLTLGTTILYYAAIEVSMAHGVGSTFVALLVWYWLRTFGSAAWHRWGLVGLLVGACALVRWQLAALMWLPAAEGILVVLNPSVRTRTSVWRTLGQLSLATAVAALAFSPQVFAWHAVYGPWLVTPFPTAHNWLDPCWWEVLAGQDRGFFYWTPLTFLACLGYFYLLGRGPATCGSGKRAPALILCGAFLIQVYVIASLWGERLYLGAAFGFRQLTESVVTLAPGLAMLLGTAWPRRFLMLAVLGGVLVLWNLLLISMYRYGWIPADRGVAPLTLVENAVRLIIHKRFLLWGQVALGPLLLLIAWWRIPSAGARGRYLVCTTAASKILSSRNATKITAIG
jgi:hypothetical protein